MRSTNDLWKTKTTRTWSFASIGYSGSLSGANPPQIWRWTSCTSWVINCVGSTDEFVIQRLNPKLWNPNITANEKVKRLQKLMWFVIIRKLDLRFSFNSFNTMKGKSIRGSLAKNLRNLLFSWPYVDPFQIEVDWNCSRFVGFLRFEKSRIHFPVLSRSNSLDQARVKAFGSKGYSGSDWLDEWKPHCYFWFLQQKKRVAH